MTKDVHLIALGKKIRSVRKGKSLSQEQVALATEFARSYFGGVERGERNISAKNLIKLAMKLDIEVGELFPSKAELKKLKKLKN